VTGSVIDRTELDFEATVPALLHRAVARFGDHELVVKAMLAEARAAEG
jgi:hypothetical protein